MGIPTFGKTVLSDLLLAAVRATGSQDGAVYVVSDKGTFDKVAEIGCMPKGGEILAESVQQSDLSINYGCLLPDDSNNRALQYGTINNKTNMSRSYSCVTIVIPDKVGSLQVQKQGSYTEEQLTLLAVTSKLLSYCCGTAGTKPFKKKKLINSGVYFIKKVENDIQPDGIDLSKPCKLLADSRAYHSSLAALLSMKTSKLNKTVSEVREMELKFESLLKENSKSLEEISVLRKKLVNSEEKCHRLQKEVKDLRGGCLQETQVDNNSNVGSENGLKLTLESPTSLGDDVGRGTPDVDSQAFAFFNSTIKSEGHSVSSVISYLTSQRSPKPCQHILFTPHFADRKSRNDNKTISVTPSVPPTVRVRRGRGMSSNLNRMDTNSQERYPFRNTFNRNRIVQVEA